ncbi:CoA transferase [Puniceibacterium sp. IMCC21224]|uniref:CoA transferase n=1 Tax=Puniceibacterium sp. IMCC21224 TaxID=1618204 RepID=UPI00064D8E24|nr:CoA transferase [Puniceibacterium sp. IMCC21224]KMK65311.1 putative acyl-CoA transferase/carnitine dehydratase [Puniceibacterium sp. IMCC21224]
MSQDKPLTGIQVVEYTSGVAGAWAGRLLAAMGAEVTLIEPVSLSVLRRTAPFLPSGESALFAYVAADKKSVICDLETDTGRSSLATLLTTADIFIEDAPVKGRAALGIDEVGIASRYPDLIHLSVLPFGSFGQKADWHGTEINLIHAGGEGFLLPNGLSASMFPERPPLKVAGHFAQMQGGVVAALSALSALWSRTGQYVDTSIQDATAAVGAFAIQRFGDGSVEHRLTRSFRYGGVIECNDGYVELLTLEERQWQGLVHLMGDPEWALDAALDDAAERSNRGDMINAKIREWARQYDVEDLVARAQELGVPMARYNSPLQILEGVHEIARGAFQEVRTKSDGVIKVQSAPFRFGDAPIRIGAAAPQPGAHQHKLDKTAPVRSKRVTV